MTTISNGRNTEFDKPHWVEWLTGILSAALVIFLIGWIGVEALTRDGEPPELSVTTLGVQQGPAGHRVTFDIANAATTTAASVVVHGEIRENGEVVDETDVTFDYVPAQSRSRGAMIFSVDPAGRELVIRPVGFTDP